MKSYKNLYEKFISMENFELAFNNAIKSKKRRREVIKYLKNKEKNLENLRQSIINKTYKTSEYKYKTIYEPKERIIYKLPLRDRIIHHAVMNVLKPILRKKFDYHSYACVEGKGQQSAVLQCTSYERKYKYALKCDISKFFPSINHNILFSMFERIIADKEFLEVIKEIIYSFKGETNCPIGNYTSQWFGNFYLTALDNFVRHQLKAEAYLRYCDDFIIFSNDKIFLNKCKAAIEEFLRENLKLKYSKADIFNIKQGVDFCGYRSFGKYILLRKRTAKRVKEKTKAFPFDEKHNGMLASYHGLLKPCNSYNLRKKIGLDIAFQVMKIANNPELV